MRISDWSSDVCSSDLASAEGPLFKLPGGSARLAFGGGMRKSKFILDIASIESGNAVPSQKFVIDRTTSYGYGEISLPVISPSNSVPLVNRLSFTAAEIGRAHV